MFEGREGYSLDRSALEETVVFRLQQDALHERMAEHLEVYRSADRSSAPPAVASGGHQK